MNNKTFEELNSIITSVDSYKVSHWSQYPTGSEEALFYIESRGGKFDQVVTAGCNRLAQILSRPVTMENVDFANRLYKMHFGREIFNYKGWKEIAELGYIPLEFRAIPEGTPVAVKNPVATFHAGKNALWLAGHVETLAIRGVWFPSTVATLSRECKKVLKKYLKKTSDLEGEAFDMVLRTRLHDFGARGTSSAESAGIGGLAHLYNFLGTDTVEALIMAISLFEDCQKAFDDGEMAAGISIPAREHSTTVSYGKENEDLAYKNSIEIFGEGMYACVYDSWDFKAAVRRIAEYKDSILSKGGTLVVRPDSGDMVDNIMYALEELGRIFGYTVNSKGYKVLHPAVRIIQGDEIHGPETINRVLNWMESNRWASENIAFGMGGGLLQEVTCDTQKYAMKMCAIKINGVWTGVYKCPKGAEWKKSKKGLLMTITDGVNFKTIDTLEQKVPEGWKDAMITYYVNGKITARDTLEEIRNRAGI